MDGDLVRRLAAARVGGTFWARQPELPAFETLVRVRSTEQAESLLRHISPRSGSVLLWCTDARATRRLRPVVADLPILVGEQDPWPLIEAARRIFADPDDEAGLIAFALGKPVHDLAGEECPPAACEEKLIRAIGGFAYRDPYFGTPIGASDWIDVLAAWRDAIDANRSIGAVAGIKAWKRGTVGPLLWAGRPTTFLRGSAAPRHAGGSALGIWSSRIPDRALRQLEDRQVRLVQIEDGFIRSIGLGAQLHPPHSIVLDRAGIYFDPRRPSDLEGILASVPDDDALLHRAAALVRAVVERGITKYAAGIGPRIDVPAQCRRVLVVGQVEDDRSVRFGAAGVAGNLDLLRRARRAEPEAWIAYRPHPDVAAGLRKGDVPREQVLSLADCLLSSGSMAQILEAVDCVHVLTSLAGFEALMRGCEVVTHGQPFYAGWGLTRDLAPALPRRQRKLTLDALVAGTLILYPRYLDPVTRLPCPPEVVIRRHAEIPHPRPTSLQRMRALQGRLALAGRRLAGVAA